MIRVAARNIIKRYGVIRALDDVDFDAHAGAVNVLIGENGAGKSTLMRIVAGVETCDGGTLSIDGQPVVLRSIADAAAHGIGIVHQELSLCPNLTVTQNIFLDRSVNSGRMLDHRAERARAVEILGRLGARIDPDTPVHALSIGEQQVVEIARALSRDVSTLILDEPSSALSAAEIEQLFAVIAELKNAGVAIIYISHRMQEIERIGDHVTILRDGRRVAYADRGEFSIPWIIQHMMGSEGTPRPHASGTPGRTMLSIANLKVRRASGALAVDGLDMEARAGELTAIYGLLGAGRSELFEAICGARPSSGSIRVDGTAIDRLPLHARLEHGVQLVPEDRKAEGLFGNLAVGQNLSVSVLDRLRRLGLVSRQAEHETITPMMRTMAVKAPSAATPIGALSGGNQQKVLIGRSLLPGPRVLLLDEPGRGVDVGARAEIFSRMRDLCAQDVAVIFSTSDVVEATTFADRILVMAQGRITADLPAAEASEEVLLRAANASARSDQELDAA
ncbi:sugar ABC transporter ATP-binding protein [Croceibacterium sp. TMG7-5b_MA50]|uniref:sugar ABC transporter ATP-binding protein n=1 Tax=Croceibacterium sp. TMG7-5b_MA50 TaxID=3121290 RepID=UPI0032219DEA